MFHGIVRAGRRPVGSGKPTSPHPHRTMARSGRTTTSVTNSRPSGPTGPKGQPFPQPGPAGREVRQMKITGPTVQQFVITRNARRRADQGNVQPSGASQFQSRLPSANIARPRHDRPRRRCQNARVNTTDVGRPIPAGDFYHSLGLPERSAGYPRSPSPTHDPTLKELSTTSRRWTETTPATGFQAVPTSDSDEMC